VRLESRSRSAPHVAVLSFRLRNPLPLSLQHHLAFELREAGEDGENELAGCALGIDRLAAEIEDAKAGPAILDSFKPLHDLPKADRRASQAIDLGDDQRVSTANVVECALQFGAFGDRRDLLLEYLRASGRLKIADLGLEPCLLFGRRGSSVSDQKALVCWD